MNCEHEFSKLLFILFKFEHNCDISFYGQNEKYEVILPANCMKGSDAEI